MKVLTEWSVIHICPGCTKRLLITLDDIRFDGVNFFATCEFCVSITDILIDPNSMPNAVVNGVRINYMLQRKTISVR